MIPPPTVVLEFCVHIQPVASVWGGHLFTGAGRPCGGPLPFCFSRPRDGYHVEREKCRLDNFMCADELVPLLDDDPEAARSYWAPFVRFDPAVDDVAVLDGQIRDIEDYPTLIEGIVQCIGQLLPPVDLNHNPAEYEGSVVGTGPDRARRESYGDEYDWLRSSNDAAVRPSRNASESFALAEMMRARDRLCPGGADVRGILDVYNRPPVDMNSPEAHAFRRTVSDYWRLARQHRHSDHGMAPLGVQRRPRGRAPRLATNTHRRGGRRSAAAARSPDDPPGDAEPAAGARAGQRIT